MFANNLPNDRKDQLIKGLTRLPSDWAITPLLGNKDAYRDKWQDEAPMPRADIQKAIQQGDLVTYTKKDSSTYQKRQFPQGYGIRTGVISGGIVAVDLDGPSATPKVVEMSGGDGLPRTVGFTSDRPGRAQHLFKIPEQYWAAIKTTKIKTGATSDDGKPEQVELRWNGCQSVLPPSVHPTTGGYRWLEGCAPWECEIAEAPVWLIELMLSEPAQDPAPLLNQPDAAFKVRSQSESRWTDEDWALSYLNALSPSRADDYDEWLAVGMALHSVNDSLINDWDRWSGQSPKYKPGDCDKKWKSFKSGKVSIGTLAHMAKQDGWRSPFELSRSHSGVGVTGFSTLLHPDTIKEVTQKADIVDVISEHVALTKRGKDFVGLCPFHDEKTPSFSVSPAKQMYYCFGCSAGGNAIKFLMGLGKHSFSTVVLELARRYQVMARSTDGTPTSLPTTPLTFQKRGSDNDGSGSFRGNPPVSAVSLRVRVLEIFNRNYSASERKEAFIELAQSTGVQLREVQELAEAIESDVGFDAESAEAKVNLPELLKNHNQELNPSDYLWGDGGRLALAMNTVAAAMPTAAAMIFSTLIPVCAAMIGTSSKIVVKASAKYAQPCIFWIAVVARSGTLKTPAQRIAIDPLVNLEVEAKRAYDKALKDYEDEKKNWQEGNPEPKKPEPRKRYLTKDATLETLERIHSDNPRGLLFYRDELAGMFKSRNAYKSGGKGADEEAELDQWNGAPAIIDRQEREICLVKTAISRTGSIQYEVMQKLAGDHEDSNGNLARWLLCAVKAPPRYLNFDDAPDTGISTLLESLYSNLEKLPQKDYFIDRDSQAILKSWQNHLVDCELQENHPGLKLVYPKIEAYTVRFALWLHCVNAILAGELPAPTIPGSTMQKAVELASFYLGQASLVFAVNSPQSGLTGRLLKIFQFAENKKKGITPRLVKTNINSFKKIPTAEILRDCQSLVKDGYFRSSGDTFFVADVGGAVGAVGAVGDLLVTPPTAETSVNQGSQQFVGDVGDVGDFEKSTNTPVPPYPNSAQEAQSPLDPSPTTNITNITNLVSETVETTVFDAVGDLPPTTNNSTNITNLVSETRNGETGNQVVRVTTNNANNTKQVSETIENTGVSDVGDMPLTTANNHQHANIEPEITPASAPPQTQQPQPSDKTVTPNVGDTVQLPDGGFGVAEMVYPDGQIGVAYDGGCKFAMWEPSELTKVAPPPVPQSDTKPAPAIELHTGMWVRCADGFHGHLGAQATDGRWYVLRPKSRKVDAESRLYAAADITLMPIQ